MKKKKKKKKNLSFSICCEWFPPQITHTLMLNIEICKLVMKQNKKDFFFFFLRMKTLNFIKEN